MADYQIPKSEPVMPPRRVAFSRIEEALQAAEIIINTVDDAITLVLKPKPPHTPEPDCKTEEPKPVESDFTKKLRQIAECIEQNNRKLDKLIGRIDI